MLQNPYGQGYIGSYALDKLRHGCKVKADAPFKTIALTNRFIDSGTVYADKDAVDNYVASMQAITKKIFADFEKTYLDLPVSSRGSNARPSPRRPAEMRSSSGLPPFSARGEADEPAIDWRQALDGRAAPIEAPNGLGAKRARGSPDRNPAPGRC